MPDPIKELTRSVDKISSSINSAGKELPSRGRSEAARERRTKVDVDALTDGEAAEIKLLIEHEDELPAFSASRLEAGGQGLAGMYAELSALDLITLELGGRCVHVSPMAHWAVEKRAQRARAADAARREQWRHDLRVALGSALFGGVLGIAGTLLGVWFGTVIG